MNEAGTNIWFGVSYERDTYVTWKDIWSGGVFESISRLIKGMYPLGLGLPYGLP